MNAKILTIAGFLLNRDSEAAGWRGDFEVEPNGDAVQNR